MIALDAGSGVNAVCYIPKPEYQPHGARASSPNCLPVTSTPFNDLTSILNATIIDSHNDSANKEEGKQPTRSLPMITNKSAKLVIEALYGLLRLPVVIASI